MIGAELWRRSYDLGAARLSLLKFIFWLLIFCCTMFTGYTGGVHRVPCFSHCRASFPCDYAATLCVVIAVGMVEVFHEDPNSSKHRPYSINFIVIYSFIISICNLMCKCAYSCIHDIDFLYFEIYM